LMDREDLESKADHAASPALPNLFANRPDVRPCEGAVMLPAHTRRKYEAATGSRIAPVTW
jgi:hypothetical protein